MPRGLHGCRACSSLPASPPIRSCVCRALCTKRQRSTAGFCHLQCPCRCTLPHAPLRFPGLREGAPNRPSPPNQATPPQATTTVAAHTTPTMPTTPRANHAESRHATLATPTAPNHPTPPATHRHPSGTHHSGCTPLYFLTFFSSWNPLQLWNAKCQPCVAAGT